ncbi:MAG: uracil-DNA glycosylase superfamily protein [Bradyrhizobium sp.]|nr:uracil-DNA glycosylase superfamily protein [Bradyrhizobium sp.]
MSQIPGQIHDNAGPTDGGRGDVLATGLIVIFCGINPASTAEVSGHNFSAPSNRFWQTVHLAGFTPVRLKAQEEDSLLDYGCGITAAVERATAKATDLQPGEVAGAIPAFHARIERLAPRVIAFLGKPVARAIAGGSVEWGLQPEPFAGARSWVLPNPSGLNRSFTIDALTRHYAALYDAVAGDLAGFRTRRVTAARGSAE